METHFWKIPWTEEPGGPQSMGSQKVGHDSLIEHTHMNPKLRWYYQL